MSLTQRKSRPLTRDAGSLRDDRLFIIACDDTYAPKQYFEFFRIARVKIHAVPTTDGTSAAEHVLARLLQFEHEEDDERWMLLDTDHCLEGRHVSGFRTAIAEAGRTGVNVALSHPCFEFWLLLHHVGETSLGSLSTCREVETALRANLGEYNKTNLKPEHYPPASVREACMRTTRLDEAVPGGDIPAANTTRVYKLWRAITFKALPWQLPRELRDL